MSSTRNPGRWTGGALPFRFSRVVWAAVVLGSLGACTPPDVPPGAVDVLPESVKEFLDPSLVQSLSLAHGVDYRRVRSPVGPWVVHLLQVDLTRCDVGLRVVPGSKGEGRQTVTELIRGSEPEILAAVNGDFFTEEGRPTGPEASSGDLRSGGSRPVLAWRPGERPWIGSVSWSGDTVSVGTWSLVSGQSDGLTEVIGGFPLLLKDGEQVGDLELADRPAFSGERHPRTAVGFDPDEDRLWLVVVDGRREGLSDGMTLDELAEFFRILGARDALNLDGGGSSAMVLRNRVVSRPSDPRGERQVANALAVKSDPALCPVGDTMAEEDVGSGAAVSSHPVQPRR